jgi:hypothetical protein
MSKKPTLKEALKTYDSAKIIGKAQERYNLRHTRYNDILGNETWRAFYDGWIEGRFDMFGDLHTMAHPVVKPNRWNDFKDFMKTAGGYINEGITRWWRANRVILREDAIMFWKIETVMIISFLSFVFGAFVMATFGIKGVCYLP